MSLTSSVLIVTGFIVKEWLYLIVTCNVSSVSSSVYDWCNGLLVSGVTTAVHLVVHFTLTDWVLHAFGNLFHLSTLCKTKTSHVPAEHEHRHAGRGAVRRQAAPPLPGHQPQPDHHRTGSRVHQSHLPRRHPDVRHGPRVLVRISLVHGPRAGELPHARGRHRLHQYRYVLVTSAAKKKQFKKVKLREQHL